MVENLFTGKSPSAVFKKIGEQLKLFGRKLDRLSVYGHLMGSLVNDNAAVLKPLVVLPAAASLEKGFHSGHQNLRTEGLPHIIIHAKIKAKKLILLLRFRCQHDNRYLGGFPDLPCHAIAVESRHHNVQDNQSDIRLLLKNIHCLQTVSRLQHLISCTNQKVMHQLAHSRFIIHNKNLLHRQHLPGCRPSLPASLPPCKEISSNYTSFRITVRTFALRPSSLQYAPSQSCGSS